VAMKLFESCPGGGGCPCASVTHYGDAWGVEVQLHEFLTSALGGEEWSASRPGRIAACTYWIRSCWFEPLVQPQSVLYLVGLCLPATCVVIHGAEANTGIAFLPYCCNSSFSVVTKTAGRTIPELFCPSERPDGLCCPPTSLFNGCRGKDVGA
jgi:hypothetical protein